MAATVYRMGRAPEEVDTRPQERPPQNESPHEQSRMGHARKLPQPGRKKTVEELARECGLPCVNGRVG